MATRSLVDHDSISGQTAAVPVTPATFLIKNRSPRPVSPSAGLNVLLVEADARLARAIAAGLAQHRIRTLHASTGHRALAELGCAELILLDLALPDINGIEACRQIRAISDVPMIIITNRSNTHARVLGLRSGADDYVDKPLNINKLLARICQVHRQYSCLSTPGTIQIDDILIDLERQVVTIADTRVQLARKEFQILAMLAMEDGGACTRKMLITELWGRPWSGAHNALNVHVATLRTKLGRPGLIRTIRGVGYRLATTRR
ncbi:response regulator transcription factor [Pseudonocardia acaciae]|uniref:response regulator transcription factor n=1 Tax=Pseudonocardia acaciae TaxID=551276 RepID=UPI0014700E5A|nr:response regulator transcription factor [Pseudonocardia acaciae]